jgi:3-oxosteroid 1-dehydrogenase
MENEVDEVDVVCVGGGLGGLAAAATAVSLGLRCAVVEASSYVGGAGAYSGGLLWAPLEPDDDVDAGDRYLAAVQGERAGDDRLRRAVLEAAVEALGAYRDLGVPVEVVPDNPDVFHPGAPGSRASGRMWEVAVPGARLGRLRPLLQPTPHYRVGLRHRELYGGRVDEVSLRELWARREAEDLLTLGPGLAAGFLHAAAVTGDATLLLGERVVALTGDGDRATGVRTDRGRGLSARLGVVLATGGYGWAADAADLEGLPDLVEAGPPTIRGDHLALAAPFGAEVARGSGPQFTMGAHVRSADVHPGTDVPLHSQLFDVMGMPHTLVVNRAGRRFGDESYYVGINEALARWSAEGKRWENVPCWLVVDEQFRRRYPLATVPPGAAYPSTVTSATDLATLAAAIGVDADGLAATVARFNEGAKRGEDPDFGRGSRAFVRRRYGDPRHEPNPNLGPVSEPPFHALPLRLLGTGMCTFGLRTDEHARVLRRDGSAVAGLHATGNAAATTEFRGYVTGYANTRNIAMAHRAVRHLSQEGTTP